MKAATLTALTAPKHIALDGSVGPTIREIAEQSRWFTPGKVIGNSYVDGRVRWNLPRGDHQIRQSYWTSAEAGMACKGLDERYYYALRFQFAMDFSVYYSLKLALLEWAIREKRRPDCDWVDRVPTERGPNSRYLEDLSAMHLYEVQCPYAFPRVNQQNPDKPPPNLYQKHMGVSKETWSRKLAKPYEQIVCEWHRWIDIGVAHMNRRLRENAA